jgi:zinc/manganese transport system substrate-binding protein
MVLIGRRVLVGLMVAASPFALASCGAGDRDTEGAADDDGRSPLVATTTIWADIVSHVACGEDVTAVIPAGADPHGFEPSLRDRELLEQAGVVVANGNHLEESLADLLETLASDGVNVVEITPHVDVIDTEHADDAELAVGDDGHDHGEHGDPHIWQDPARVAGALDVIASAVIASGRPAAQIEACTATYRDELEALDAEIAGELAAIPFERRLLVTNHDAFAYFADRYDFEVIGSVIPSSSTLGESSAGQLAELAETIAAQGVPAIFTERLGSSADAEALAERLGVAVVELDSDSLTADGPASSYVGLLRANAQAIAAALA